MRSKHMNKNCEIKTSELDLETALPISKQKQIITYDANSNIDYQSLETGTIVKLFFGSS